jgi:hypothetical protein
MDCCKIVLLAIAFSRGSGDDMSECECGGRGVLAVFYIVFLERAFGFAGLERVYGPGGEIER